MSAGEAGFGVQDCLAGVGDAALDVPGRAGHVRPGVAADVAEGADQRDCDQPGAGEVEQEFPGLAWSQAGECPGQGHHSVAAHVFAGVDREVHAEAGRGAPVGGQQAGQFDGTAAATVTHRLDRNTPW